MAPKKVDNIVNTDKLGPEAIRVKTGLSKESGENYKKIYTLIKKYKLDGDKKAVSL